METIVSTCIPLGMKEDDICELLKFERKMLRARISTLRNDKFIQVRLKMETGSDGKAQKVNYYFINYKVNYYSPWALLCNQLLYTFTFLDFCKCGEIQIRFNEEENGDRGKRCYQ